MKSIKEIFVRNLPWIITSLLAVGAFVATVKYQGDAIAACEKLNEENRDRIFAIEKAMVKLEIIQEDIKTIREDVKDIKKVVFRPIVGSNISENQNDAKVMVSRKSP